MKHVYFYALLFLTLGLFSCKKDQQVIIPVIEEPTTISIVTPTPAPPVKRVIAILGSSTAAGMGPLSIDSSWVYRLKKYYKSKPNVEVINMALGGYSTYQTCPTGYIVANRPKPDTLRNVTKAIKLKADLVLIKLPSNDIADGYSEKEAIDNFKRMVDDLNAAKINYIIFGTQPRNISSLLLRTSLKTLNTSLSNIYTTRFYDYYDELTASNYLIKSEYGSGDGVHFNSSAHALIFNGLVPRLPF